MRLTCVILAAGEGKRMNSPVPKIILCLCGKPMLCHVIGAVEKLKPAKKIVVAGRHHDKIKEALSMSGISYVLQPEPLGTGDAVLKAVNAAGKIKDAMLVLNGDMPLITADMLKKFLNLHRRNRNSLSVLSFIAEDPSMYGRILRDDSGKAVKIIEDKDATPRQKAVREVNAGVYLINPGVVSLIREIDLNKKKGEYYLTDLVGMAIGNGLKTGVYCIGTEEQLMGINNRHEFLKAQAIMQQRIINGFISKGVSFLIPSSANIHADVRIGKDTLIYPNVSIEGGTKIGTGCTIHSNVRITESLLGDNVLIKDSSVIEDSLIRSNARIGPFAHLRPGSIIGCHAKIGNFVEVKKSLIGDRTKALHLSYIGDSDIGKDVNVGAGTITCNYDGSKKHRTVVKDNVFIGSDSQLVAPVSIGIGAYIGAGSTITRDVPPMALALSRTNQKNIKGWALKRRSKVRNQKSKVKGERV